MVVILHGDMIDGYDYGDSHIFRVEYKFRLWLTYRDIITVPRRSKALLLQPFPFLLLHSKEQ